MKAPVSNRARQILSDPGAARSLGKQVIESRRTNHNAEIRIDDDRFELVRVTGRFTASPDEGV